MDGVELTVTILKESLGVPVGTEVPRNRPQRFIMVDLDGDESSPLLLRPRIALTCWGATDKDARGIALSALDALQEASEDHPYLSDASLETMSREEWSRSGQGRYLALINLTINVDE